MIDRRRLLALVAALGTVLVLPRRPDAAADLPYHHAGGLFRNPPGSPERDGSTLDWAGFFWRNLNRRGDQPGLPPGHRLPPDAVRAGLAGGDGATWLGHSSWLVRLAGLTLLTDPFLTDHASPVPPLGPRRFAPPALAPEALPPLDLVLLSHNHYDHLDRATLGRLPGRDRITLVTPLGVGRYVADLGFARTQELDWGQPVTHGAARVTATPAIHFSKRGLFDRNASLWCGFLIEAAGKRVYFAGDTAYGPVFEALGRDLAPLDLALVPIGAYEPRPLMRGTHCTPEEAVRIARHLGARRLAAMHWGTIRLTDEPWAEPPGRFRAAAAEAGYAPEACLVPAIGATIAL